MSLGVDRGDKGARQVEKLSILQRQKKMETKNKYKKKKIKSSRIMRKRFIDRRERALEALVQGREHNGEHGDEK